MDTAPQVSGLFTIQTALGEYSELAWVPGGHARSTSNGLAPPLVTRWKPDNDRSAAVAVTDGRPADSHYQSQSGQ